MKTSVVAYFIRQEAFIALAAMVVGLVLGVLKTLVEVLLGHPFLASMKAGVLFFFIPFHYCPVNIRTNSIGYHP
jgi:biotin transporter BioY